MTLPIDNPYADDPRRAIPDCLIHDAITRAQDEYVAAIAALKEQCRDDNLAVHIQDYLDEIDAAHHDNFVYHREHAREAANEAEAA